MMKLNHLKTSKRRLREGRYKEPFVWVVYLSLFVVVALSLLIGMSLFLTQGTL